MQKNSTKKVGEYLHGIFRFCQADKNKKGKNKWKMKMCDEWGVWEYEYRLSFADD